MENGVAGEGFGARTRKAGAREYEMRKLTCVVLSVALALALAIHVGATTYKPDKDALLEFKAGIDDPGGLLSSWSEWTGACRDLGTCSF